VVPPGGDNPTYPIATSPESETDAVLPLPTSLTLHREASETDESVQL